MEIKGKETKYIFIEYTQKFKEKKAVYITTTTQFWKKPLEGVEFLVIVPAHFKEVEISYKPEKIKKKKEKAFYYIKKFTCGRFSDRI